jgi:lipopolysaccharide export LptBFGC system permease protein LptF
MNSIINKYLLVSYFKIFINTILIFFSLGVLINLFEEIEFFKNLDQSLIFPLLLSLSVVPSLIFDLLPFIIFLSAVFYFIKIRTNKNLLSFKIFGYSNLRLIIILSVFSMILGIFF